MDLAYSILLFYQLHEFDCYNNTSSLLPLQIGQCEEQGVGGCVWRPLLWPGCSLLFWLAALHRSAICYYSRKLSLPNTR